jgi:hypothetical protein
MGAPLSRWAPTALPNPANVEVSLVNKGEVFSPWSKKEQEVSGVFVDKESTQLQLEVRRSCRCIPMRQTGYDSRMFKWVWTI